MIPIDVVAGTFGANMTKGGANGEMAAFLIIVLGFLLSRLRHQVPGAHRALWVAPLVAMPLFMGETKIAVVLIPLLFLTLYRRTLLSSPVLGIRWLGAWLSPYCGRHFGVLESCRKGLGDASRGHAELQRTRPRVRQSHSEPYNSVVALGPGARAGRPCLGNPRQWLGFWTRRDGGARCASLSRLWSWPHRRISLVVGAGLGRPCDVPASSVRSLALRRKSSYRSQIFVGARRCRGFTGSPTTLRGLSLLSTSNA